MARSRGLLPYRFRRNPWVLASVISTTTERWISQSCFTIRGMRLFPRRRHGQVPSIASVWSLQLASSDRCGRLQSRWQSRFDRCIPKPIHRCWPRNSSWQRRRDFSAPADHYLDLLALRPQCSRFQWRWHLDLALLDRGTNQIAVLLGNGDGTFQPPIETQTAYGQVLPGDLNNDGKLDFVMLGSGAPIPVGIMLGNGDGTFQPPQFYSTRFDGQEPFFTLADFTSDGDTDVLSYGQIGHLAGFLAGHGDGTMQPVSRFTLPGPMFKLFAVAEDFNSDGLLDFAIAVASGTEVFLQAPQ